MAILQQTYRKVIEREHYEQLYTKNSIKNYAMDKFLETHRLEQTQEQTVI